MVVFVEALPRSPIGKVLRHSLPELVMHKRGAGHGTPGSVFQAGMNSPGLPACRPMACVGQVGWHTPHPMHLSPISCGGNCR